MSADKTVPESIDDYILGFPPEVQAVLRNLREAVRQSAPFATEMIRWEMPTFDLHGHLVYFAAHKKHIGFYPMPSAIEAFQDELAAYKHAKGTVQFPLDKPLPYPLIRRMVKFRVAENMKKAAEKSKKKKK